MNPESYFKSLSEQLAGLKDRVRQLIGEAHWPSDGEWKESVLRSVLRGYLPSSMTIGTGFIVTPREVSPQIDILIFDDSGPILFRDGDFVVVTPDVVRAVIEVKTSLPKAKFTQAVKKLSRAASIMAENKDSPPQFVGLFSFEEPDFRAKKLLPELVEHNRGGLILPIHALSFGTTDFIRYWPFEPGKDGGIPYNSWHSYSLEYLAQGYFVHNVIDHLFPERIKWHEPLWYPGCGKEGKLTGREARAMD